MSDFKHKAMSGSLFRNKQKKSDKSPDYTGTVNVRGEVLRIAGWLKGNPPYLSLAFSEPREQTAKTPQIRDAGEDFQDDDLSKIPF